jgi:chemotaxis protein MotB
MSGGGGADSRWLVSYADLVTLLMAFFVALYGISNSTSQKKFNDFLKGLGAFGNPAAANSGILKGGPSIVGSGTGVGQSQPGTSAAGSSGGVSGVSTSGGSATASTPTQLSAVESQIQASLNAAGIGNAVTFTVQPRGLEATISTDNVLFATGSSQVTPAGQKIIGAIAPTLKSLTNAVLIEGYTDNVPLNQNGYTNWNLSTDRAVAVLQILQTADGIDPNRLSAAGYGEYHPVASNATAAGRQTNRRVNIVILTDATAATTGPINVPIQTPTP